MSCCCEPNSEIGEDCRGRPCRALSDRGTEGQNEAGRGVAENGPAEASLLCGAGLLLFAFIAASQGFSRSEV